jgi:hypothetical protein
MATTDRRSVARAVIASSDGERELKDKKGRVSLAANEPIADV